ncbi:MAG: OmpA family protein [Bacteroidia bacterium]
MKIIKIITASCLVFSLFSSCVSKKKYNDMAKNCKGEYSILSAQNEELKSNIQGLKASSSAELQEKQQQLSEKEKALKEREKKLEELKNAMSLQRDAVYNLKQQVCSALKCFSPDELTVDMREGKLYVSLSDKLLFPSGSEDVNSRGKEALEMLSAVLSQSDLEIMVEGHTDPVPISTSRNRDNWDLSVHRATNVTRIMIGQGIKPERIIPCGRGQFKPIASNETVEGKQQNRRTEIVLAPKLDKLWKLTQEEAEPTSQN